MWQRLSRSRYRSQARILQDEPYFAHEPYGRAPVRDLEYSPARCDNWTFAAGDYVTLLAFNYPSPRSEQQHHRWFAVARLDVGEPKQTNPNAAR